MGSHRLLTVIGAGLATTLTISPGRSATSPIAALQAHAATAAVVSSGPLISPFEPNAGQTDPQVRFLSRGRGYRLFLTSQGAVLSSWHEAGAASVLRMSLVGSNPDGQITPLDPLPGRSNYFIGSDPRRWRKDIPQYGRVSYQEVWPHVDLVYYGSQRRLEYDFVVRPGGDPGRIRLHVDGSRTLAIDEGGDLIVQVGEDEFRIHKPVVYQRAAATQPGERHIEGRFVRLGARDIGFDVANYDRSRTLVIDPVISYATYLGGSGFDSGRAVAVDAAGSAYVTGETASLDFPTLNPDQSGNAGTSDVFITKLSPDGASLVYSTYLGGTLAERGNGIAVDSAGNVSVTGRTNSEDFPIMNPWQSQLSGDFDAFITQLSPSGNAILYSTYLGGSGFDEGAAIAADASGSLYVTGGTGVGSRDDFITTTGAFQRLYGGGMNDAFVTKFDPTQSGSASLVYSTFLGGSDRERGNGIAIDGAGNAYVTGRTTSAGDFPVMNALQPNFGGGLYDAFVTALSSDGTSLLYSTYLGGTGNDQGYGIAVDAAANVYLAGQTNSTDFPTANAYQAASGGGNDAFAAEIDSTGSVLVYSTYLGGTGEELSAGIAVDGSGVIYVTGRTTDAGFPTTPDALQPAFGGGLNDAFVARLDPSQSGSASLLYSSFLGGAGDENVPAVGPAGNPPGGIAVDGSGNVYVTGNTTSTNFPTMNPFQGMYGGDPADAFVVRISF